jgi:polysaccharide deacetylase 2 family uncharacterized protein YibQ
MASQSHNKNSKNTGSPKRSSSLKNTPKKKTASKTKKRAVRKKKKQKQSKKGFFLLLILVAMVSMVGTGYYLGQHDLRPVSSKTNNVTKKTVSHQKEAVKKKSSAIFSKVETKQPKKKVEQHPAVKKRESYHPHIQKKEKRKIALAYRSKKPKLVIIIDDVSNARQLRQIKALHIPVTPSIFPPYARAMHSNTLARGLKHYMIHLPMESGNRQFNTQYKTLKTSFSKAEMAARMREIRRLFPTARYINNHTGSVFTNNTKAMKMLYGIMKKEGFVFVDSRTIGSSKVKKIAHAYGDAYVARDIFIDNTQTIPYIHKQLKKAVEIAKKRGYAIAIGHPRKTTMQALASAKNIFKDVDLVYIDQIYQKR